MTIVQVFVGIGTTGQGQPLRWNIWFTFAVVCGVITLGLGVWLLVGGRKGPPAPLDESLLPRHEQHVSSDTKDDITISDETKTQRQRTTTIRVDPAHLGVSAGQLSSGTGPPEPFHPKAGTEIELYDLVLERTNCRLKISEDGTKPSGAEFWFDLKNGGRAKLRYRVTKLSASLGGVGFVDREPGGAKWDGVILPGNPASFYLPGLLGVSLDKTITGELEVWFEYGEPEGPSRFGSHKKMQIQIETRVGETYPTDTHHVYLVDEDWVI